ncbi:MAG: aminotransferase class I/II-fold pyridoxal phosphate-dependent enzyme, partial [Bacteroidales bacterium]|nr:aminotransferase class I/II-fold pyridoxal phosphate-dependent enzyme [Bacteroidales bacterium]
MYNFDEIIDRRGTGAIKCDFLMEKYGRDDLIPMWIADMDFATPDFILDAIRQRMQHPVFGYFLARQDYYNVLSQWEKKMHDWDIDPSEIAFIPGIVKGIYFAIDCFTDKGDAVVVQPPVYMPFLSLPVCDGRKVLYNKLKLVNGLYEMDFENLEKIFRDSSPKMMIISNPHNPGGRIWPKETLATLAALAKRYGVIVVSDEIHADMPLNGNCFTPFLAAGEDAEQVGIAFCAPSKTFNMAGIVSSFSVVKNSTLRERYYAFLAGNDLDLTMVLSTVATEAAYTKGETWRKECISYIQDNIKYVCDFLS